MDHLTFWGHIMGNVPQGIEENNATISEFFQCSKIYFVDSGRSAIYLALRALGVNAGDEILMTAFNCPAVVEAVLSAGGIPKFVDINESCGLDIDGLNNARGKKTKGIIVTHVFGIVDDLKELSKFCAANDLFLLNDLAQTLEDPGTTEKLNHHGDISIYSFGPEKHLFALGGGALMTHDHNLRKRIEEILPGGVVKKGDVGALLLSRDKYYLTFFVHRKVPALAGILARLGVINKLVSNKEISIGSNPVIPKRMHPIQMLVLIRKLKSYRSYCETTQKNFNILRAGLALPVLYISGSLPLYASVRIDNKVRFAVSDNLAQRGVQTVWNYLPLYRAKGASADVSLLPKTEDAWQCVLSLPFRFPIKEKRVKEICSIFNECLKT